MTARAERGGLPLGAILLGIASLGGLAIALLHLDRLPLFVCLFRAATGIPCMTCGATRAAARLVAGDIMGALAMNPLATVAASGLVVWGMADLALLPRGAALAVDVTPGTARALRIGAVAAVLVNWAYLVAVGR
jgi:hypothetical protein